MLRSASASSPSSAIVSRTRARTRSSGHAKLSSAKATSPVESTLKNWVRGFWNTLPTRAAISQLSRPDAPRPSTSTRPDRSPGKNAGASPFASRVTVVLPHPDGPHTSTHRPASTLRLTFRTPSGAGPAPAPPR